jgi:plastocyanin
MDLKQWMGAVGAGVGAIALAFFLNEPTDIRKMPGVRAPRAEAVAEPSAPADRAPAIEVPASQEPDVREAPSGPAPTRPAPARPATRPEPAAQTGATQVSRPAGEKGPSIQGKVLWQGDSPKNPKIDMGSDPVCKDLCKDHSPEKETYVINENGTLRNVCVYVSKGLPAGGSFPARSETVVIDQVNCTYVPHVVAFQLGQKVQIRNSDPTTHNVHFKSRLNGDWNMTQAEKGSVPPKEDFKRAELGTASLKCDIHTWMEAKVLIFDHPFFAVTGEDGSFSLDGLPAGTYTLTAWHEREKAQTAEVVVKDGATAELSFTFSRGGK